MASAALAGKTIVITGAGRGLGAALAISFADAGADLVLCGRTPATLASTRDAIVQRTGRTPPTIPLDLADVNAVERAAMALAAQRTAIDVLINNGAFWLGGALENATPAEIAQCTGSALTGTLLFTRALLPLLRRSAAPDIVNIVSMSGLPQVALQGASVAFYAAKHGQAGLTDGLREELRGTPVRVIGIYPPVIDDVSPLAAEWADLPGRPKAARISNRDVVESVAFALARSRNCMVASLILDADMDGLRG